MSKEWLSHVTCVHRHIRIFNTSLSYLHMNESCLSYYRLAKTYSLKLQVIFRKRATNNRAFLRKMTYKDKASYDSTPPCHESWTRSLLQKNPIKETIFCCILAHVSLYVFLHMYPYIRILQAYLIVAQTFTYVFCKHMEMSHGQTHSEYILLYFQTHAGSICNI